MSYSVCKPHSADTETTSQAQKNRRLFPWCCQQAGQVVFVLGQATVDDRIYCTVFTSTHHQRAWRQTCYHKLLKHIDTWMEYITGSASCHSWIECCEHKKCKGTVWLRRHQINNYSNNNMSLKVSRTSLDGNGNSLRTTNGGDVILRSQSFEVQSRRQKSEKKSRQKYEVVDDVTTDSHMASK